MTAITVGWVLSLATVAILIGWAWHNKQTAYIKRFSVRRGTSSSPTTMTDQLIRLYEALEPGPLVSPPDCGAGSPPDAVIPAIRAHDGQFA